MPSVSETIARILATLTPERLREIVERLSRGQAPDDEGVPVGSIIDALSEGQDLGSGAEWWQATLALQRGIREKVAQSAGLRYIEVDS